MKTIKRKKQVRLDELISYIWKNEITSTVFQSCKGKEVNVGLTGTISHDPVYYFNKEDLFLIEEEVEITEEMCLDLVEVYINYCGSFQCNTNEHISIRHLLQVNNSEDVRTKFIYLQNEDGSIGELIWKDGKLI